MEAPVRGTFGVLFRKLERDARPGPGEIVFRPHGLLSARARQRTLDVLSDPAAAVRLGPAPMRHFVLDPGASGPNFDDMLATTVVARWLRDDPPLPGLARFARYAARMRNGLPVTRVPVEQSLEGLFLESRKVWDRHLNTLSATDRAARFLESWRKIEAAILQAARDDVDPGLYVYDEEVFHAERAFLQSDRKRYFEDVADGERWRVSFPDRPSPVAGLFLRHPRSSLFKQWADQDPQCGSPSDYGFLAVLFDTGSWVFCTARERRQPLGFLADLLQQAEDSLAGDGPGDDPWFRGEPFDGSLVASPRSGTLLTEEQVLRIAKQALDVRRWKPLAGSGSFASKSLLADWPLPEFRNPQPLREGGQQAPIFRAEVGTRQVALKVFGLESTTEAMERNQREIDVVRKLQHRLHEKFDPRGRFLAVAERIVEVRWRGCDLSLLVSAFRPEGSLRDWRQKRETLPHDQLQSLVRAIGEGLGYLHALNLVHCDVKPQNILVSRGRQGFSAALTDFGCTLEQGNNTRFRDPVFAPPADETTSAADLVSFAYVVAWLIAPGDQPMRFQGGCEVRADVLEPAEEGGWIEDVDEDWYDAATNLLLEASRSDPALRPTLGRFLDRFAALPCAGALSPVDR